MSAVKKRVIEEVQESFSDKHKRSLKKVLFTIIIAFAIVAFWRGAWGILDVFLFPNNPLSSSVASLLIGIIILYFTKHLVRELI